MFKIEFGEMKRQFDFKVKEVSDFKEVIEYLKGVVEEINKLVKEELEQLELKKNEELDEMFLDKEKELFEVFENLFLNKIMVEEY